MAEKEFVYCMFLHFIFLDVRYHFFLSAYALYLYFRCGMAWPLLGEWGQSIMCIQSQHLSFYPDSHLCYQSVPVKISCFLFSDFIAPLLQEVVSEPLLFRIPSNMFCCCDTLTMTINLFFRYNIPGTIYSYSTTYGCKENATLFPL